MVSNTDGLGWENPKTNELLSVGKVVYSFLLNSDLCAEKNLALAETYLSFLKSPSHGKLCGIVKLSLNVELGLLRAVSRTLSNDYDMAIVSDNPKLVMEYAKLLPEGEYETYLGHLMNHMQDRENSKLSSIMGVAKGALIRLDEAIGDAKNTGNFDRLDCIASEFESVQNVDKG